EEIENMVEVNKDKKSYAKVVDDDDVNDKEKQDESKDDNVEKTDDAAKEKDSDDHTDHALARTQEMGSLQNKTKKMQTPIPTLNISPRKDLSSDKIILEELIAPISATMATTSKSKSNRAFASNKTKILPTSIVAYICKTNEMIKEEMPRLVDLVVQKDQEIAPINVPELILKEFSIHGPKMIKELFRKHM
nr:hypothetical protein [Tanacetum cinerariifolium]